MPLEQDTTYTYVIQTKQSYDNFWSMITFDQKIWVDNSY